MAANIFEGWSIVDLEAALRRAQEDLISGKATTRVSSGDVSRQSETQLSPMVRIRLIQAALHAADPDSFEAPGANSVVRVSF